MEGGRPCCRSPPLDQPCEGSHMCLLLQKPLQSTKRHIQSITYLTTRRLFSRRPPACFPTGRGGAGCGDVGWRYPYGDGSDHMGPPLPVNRLLYRALIFMHLLQLRGCNFRKECLTWKKFSSHAKSQAFVNFGYILHLLPLIGPLLPSLFLLLLFHFRFLPLLSLWLYRMRSSRSCRYLHTTDTTKVFAIIIYSKRLKFSLPWLSLFLLVT